MFCENIFNKKGYATSIDTAARYIMSPIIYNNIYKGALGEAVVEFVLTKLTGCELEFCQLIIMKLWTSRF